jgi:hypothetical protein
MLQQSSTPRGHTQRAGRCYRVPEQSWHANETEFFNKRSQIFLVLHKISSEVEAHPTEFPPEFDCVIGLEARRIGPPELGSRVVGDSTVTHFQESGQLCWSRMRETGH